MIVATKNNRGRAIDRVAKQLLLAGNQASNDYHYPTTIIERDINHDT